MKIVMFSINPVFPKKVTGGASKHLYHIAQYLGKQGHDVEILCARPEGSLSPFNWAENVSVSPILPFDIPFPQPYAISGADLSLTIDLLASALQDADRFYIHDGEWLVPDVYEAIPTVTSFRDNVYPESVLGTFIGKADDVICVSSFSAAVIEHTAGRFFPDLRNRMHQINNGIDFNLFTKTDVSALSRELGVDPEQDSILLHPHRPEPGKGLPETIQVVDRLVQKHGLKNLKVLIPEWIGSMVSKGDSAFYNEMMRFMNDLGVSDHFVFVPWMPISRMPELYSLGDATLCLGNIVEAFGNVAYESLACGTPSIVARVGVHRTMLPDDMIAKVHYGDIESAVDWVRDIIKGKSQVEPKVKKFLRTNMDFNKQVNAYADIITHCNKRKRLQFRAPDFTSAQPYALAPWCYFDDERIYHDFRGEFTQAAQLADLLSRTEIISKDDAKAAGIPENRWEIWVKAGWIVPVEASVERNENVRF